MDPIVDFIYKDHILISIHTQLLGMIRFFDTGIVLKEYFRSYVLILIKSSLKISF